MAEATQSLDVFTMAVLFRRTLTAWLERRFSALYMVLPSHGLTGLESPLAAGMVPFGVTGSGGESKTYIDLFTLYAGTVSDPTCAARSFQT